MYYRFLYQLIFAFIFIIFFSPHASAQNSLSVSGKSHIKLPNTVSKNQSQALQKWIEHPIEAPFNNFYISKRKIFGEAWLDVYFEMNVYYNSLGYSNRPRVEYIRKDLIKSLARMTNQFAQPGQQIRIMFSSYIQVFNDDEKIESFGYKRRGFKRNFRAIDLMILDPQNPKWPEKYQYRDGSGRSYAVPTHDVIFLNSQEPDALTHEISHVLFNYHDAYYEIGKDNVLSKEEAQCVQGMINMSNCTGPLDPIEIYAGLRKAGYESPGWEDYVNRSDAFRIETNGIRLFTSNLNLYNQNIYIKIKDSNSNIVFEKTYCNMNSKECVSRDGEFSSKIANKIIVNNLSPGRYSFEVDVHEKPKVGIQKSLPKNLQLSERARTKKGAFIITRKKTGS